MRDVDFTVFTALHRFLSPHGAIISFEVVSLASYSTTSMMLEFASTVPSVRNTDKFLLNNNPTMELSDVMVTIPMILLFDTMETQDGE